MQERKQTRYQRSRRAILRNTAVVGFGLAGGTLVTQVTSPLAMASDKPGFVWISHTNFTLNHCVLFFACTNNYFLHYNSHFMIYNGLQNALAMGLRAMHCCVFLDCNH